MNLRGRSAIAGILILLGAAAASASELRLTIKDGTVTLIAKDVPARQILAEWARVGRTRIVNGERVPGGPLTLELVNVPEGRALETVLRSVSGFMAAQRAVPDANASVYDRIVVMPTVAPATSSASATQRPNVSPQQFRLQQPGFMRGRTGPAFVNPSPPDPSEAEEEDPGDDEEVDEPDEEEAAPARQPNAPVGLRQPGMVPTTVPPHPIDPYQGDGNLPPAVLNGTQTQGLAQGAAVPGLTVPNPTPAVPVIPPPPKPPKKGGQ